MGLGKARVLGIAAMRGELLTGSGDAAPGLSLHQYAPSRRVMPPPAASIAHNPAMPRLSPFRGARLSHAYPRLAVCPLQPSSRSSHSSTRHLTVAPT
jgi:hypothetical protein